jgi:hypothetical protein
VNDRITKFFTARGGRRGEDGQSADRLEFVSVRGVAPWTGEEGQMDQGLDAVGLQQVEHGLVGRGLGEIHLAEQHRPFGQGGRRHIDDHDVVAMTVADQAAKETFAQER